MDDKELIGGGLLELPEDPRDLSFATVFGTIAPLLIPNEDWVVANPIAIKNQHNLDFCPAYSGAAVKEDQEEVELDPLYLFAKIKQIRGEWSGWGADLRSGCMALVKYGCIEQKDSPYKYDRTNRDFLANWNNWPKALDEKALKHKAESFFAVDGPYDTFDNIRSALWKNKAEKRSVYTGCTWQKEWTYSKLGMIPKVSGTKAYGHAFKLLGQKMFGNEPYIVAQLSNGDVIGDKGIYYFSRGVVNREFKFGNYTFKDMPMEKAKYYNNAGMLAHTDWWYEIWFAAKKLLQIV